MKIDMTFVKGNKSQKNGKTYIELLNPTNYSKLIFEAEDKEISLFGYKQGDKVEAELDLSGENFKHRLTLTNIQKK